MHPDALPTPFAGGVYPGISFPGGLYHTHQTNQNLAYDYGAVGTTIQFDNIASSMV